MAYWTLEKKSLKHSPQRYDNMSKLTKILLIVGLFDLAFIATMIYVYMTTGQEMTTLTTCVLGASGIEAIVSALIKITNIKDEKKKEENNDISG